MIDALQVLRPEQEEWLVDIHCPPVNDSWLVYSQIGDGTIGILWHLIAWFDR